MTTGRLIRRDLHAAKLRESDNGWIPCCIRLWKDFEKCMVITLVIVNFFLLARNNIPCSNKGALDKKLSHSSESFSLIGKLTPETEHHIQEKKKPQTRRKKLLESDLLLNSSSWVELKKYRRILLQKIEELKLNGLLRKIRPKEPCNLTVGDGPCLDTWCKWPIHKPTSDDNILSALKPLTRIHHNALERVSAILNPYPQKAKIAFLTATSSKYFLETQGLLKYLHRLVLPRNPNITLNVYDLGLHEREHVRLQRLCGSCIIRKYPVDSLPERFSFIRGHTWKPLIINAHLPYTQYVVWMDASVRFTTTRLDTMFQQARDLGLLIAPRLQASIGEHTSMAMFNYFSSRPCHFQHYTQGDGSLHVIHNQPFTRDLFIKVWAGCALDPECMCPHRNADEFNCTTVKAPAPPNF